VPQAPDGRGRDLLQPQSRPERRGQGPCHHGVAVSNSGLVGWAKASLRAMAHRLRGSGGPTVHRTKPERTRRKPFMAQPIVQVRNLYKSFSRGAEEIKVLQALNLDVGAAEFMTLMGPSGSGKTTLLNLIAGLDQPTSGSIVVDNQMISEMSESQLARW